MPSALLVSAQARAGATRRELLAAGARLGTAGAVAATGALTASGTLCAFAASAADADASADPAPVSATDRLQRLIRLELLLLYCYRHVLDSAILRPGERRTLSPFVAQEEAHLAALTRRLEARGGSVPAGPHSVEQANKYLGHRGIGGRLGQLRGDRDAIRTLLTLEQVTIGAYYVALTLLADRELIVLCCQIMANEAQHDAMLGLLLPPHKPGAAVPYGLVHGIH